MSKSRINSLYTSMYVSVTLNCSRRSFVHSVIFRNKSVRVNTMRPGWSMLPSMVNVLPAPVAPYANTVALNPFSTPSTTNLVVWLYTYSCDAPGPKLWSNA